MSTVPNLAAKHRTLLGHLDNCSTTSVHGWAYYRPDPDTRPTIVCFIDGKPVAQGVANLPRSDLEHIGLGDGRYAFTIELPTELVDGKHHLLEVKARIDGIDHPLQGGSRLHLFEVADALIGHVTVNSDGLVHGWALNKAKKEEAVAVRISAGPRHILEVHATEYRADLAELKLGTGHHGFQAVIPWNWYDACAHNEQLNITVEFERNGSALAGSPLTLNVANSYKARAELENTHTEEAPRPKTLISVVMPVYNPPEAYLIEAIESVRMQSHPHWQLCIADDASPDPRVHELLRDYAERDPRIHVVFRSKNGNISRASNSALELVQGSHFALLDHDDVLHPDALLHVARAVHANPDLGIIFSDEDKCTASGQRFSPYHKAGWDRELLLGQNCVSHLGVFRTDLVKDLGGFRTGYEGSQDYDMTLRASRKLRDDQVLHIPRVLYHWRAIPGSTALANSEKSYAVVAMRKALQSHLKAIGLKAAIEPVQNGVFCRVEPKLPNRLPALSLLWVVAPGTSSEQAQSILDGLKWPRMQVICAAPVGYLPPNAVLHCISDANSQLLTYDPALQNTPDLLETLLDHATGELCLCITESVSPTHSEQEWLHTLAAHALRQDIGFVCPRVHDGSMADIYAATRLNPATRSLAPRYTPCGITSAGGGALLNHQTDSLVPALFVAKTDTLKQALVARLLSPSMPWHHVSSLTLKQQGQHSIVLPHVLFQQTEAVATVALAHPILPWFSIILPTHNRKQLLQQAIDSALHQQYQNFELIIVDDGSTDGTEAMISSRYAPELRDSKLVYKRQPRQGGVSRARNIGLACARHEWIAYLDSDNRMRNSFLSVFANAIIAHPERTAFYANFQALSGKPVVGKPFNYEALKEANYIDLGVFVHTKSMTDTLGGFDTRLKRLVDWDLILRLTCKNEPLHLPYTAMDYNDHEQDNTRISVQEAFEEARQAIYLKHLPSTPLEPTKETP